MLRLHSLPTFGMAFIVWNRQTRTVMHTSLNGRSLCSFQQLRSCWGRRQVYLQLPLFLSSALISFTVLTESYLFLHRRVFACRNVHFFSVDFAFSVYLHVVMCAKDECKGCGNCNWFLYKAGQVRIWFMNASGDDLSNQITFADV